MVPSVPHKSDYSIDHDAKPEVDALFTDGNTTGLKVTFLTPEEREPFVAELMWRDEEENGTAETRTIQVFYDPDGGFEVRPRHLISAIRSRFSTCRALPQQQSSASSLHSLR